MSYSLRKATKEDFDRINELFKEMLVSVYGHGSHEGYREEDMDYFFADGENWICVAEIDGRVEGYISIEVHREEKEFLYYDDFCVGEKCRGMGIGSVLMKRAEEYAGSLGISAIVLHVEESNVSARGFYEKRGFTLLRNDGTRLCLIKKL